MRLFLGLAALAAVSAQDVVISGSNTGSSATFPQIGTTALSAISARQQNSGGALITPTNPDANFNTGTPETSSNWGLIVPNSVTAVYFTFTTNVYVGQIQYRWAPNYTSGLGQSYTCDICTGANTGANCNTATGPGAPPSPTTGYPCASLTRNYLFENLIPSVRGTGTTYLNSFSVQVFDIQTNPAPDVSSYSFVISRAAPTIAGDPQIVGLQGQDFQVHGMPDEIFNMITYPNLQVNARFVYLSSGACHDNFTACFAHPGTYISEEGIRLGKDKIHVEAGSFKRGLTVSVNGKKVTEKNTKVKLGSVEIVNHRQVVIKTPIMAISISNSDKFLNQETSLFDQKLLDLGSERKTLLVGESFHPEVPLHGLQGQTWRNVEYPSGLDYEGSISDYHVTDGNLYGSKFVFNQFKH